jgi:cation diffusion facilitator family transporter
MSAEGSRSAVVAAVVGNTAISVAKFVAAAITGSAAMLAEGIHSVADTGNQLMLLWGLGAAKRDADAEHPFGRGKEVYFWSFMVAVMLFAGGAVFAFNHGISAIRHPSELGDQTASVIVLVVSIFIEGFSFSVALREFNKVRGNRSTWRSIHDTKDTAILVVLLEDSAAMTGLLLALVGVGLASITGDPIWDGIATLAIAALLAVVAFVLAFETKSLMIGEAASRSDRAQIRATVLSHPNVEQVGRLLTMHMGPNDILVNLDVDLKANLGDEGIEQTIDDIETAIRQVIPEANNIFVELESIVG